MAANGNTAASPMFQSVRFSRLRLVQQHLTTDDRPLIMSTHIYCLISTIAIAAIACQQPINPFKLEI